MLKKLLMVFITVGVGFSTMGQRVDVRYLGTGLNKITLHNSSLSGLSFEFNLGGVSLTTFRVNGKDYVKLDFPNSSHTQDVGLPDIPLVSMKAAVPKRAEISIEYTVESSEEIKNILLYPAQKLLPETPDGKEKAVFSLDSDFYSQDTWYPVIPVSHSPIYTIRGVDVTTILLSPFQYNPARKMLRILKKLKVDIHFTGGGSLYDPRLISPYFQPVFKKLLINSDLVSFSTHSKDGDGADMIYFVPDSLYDSLRPLVEWRNLSGIRTQVVLLSELGNPVTAQAIRAYILNAYNTWNPAPSFVAIVGDAELIPPDYRFHHPYTDELIGTDVYYAEMDSNSLVPFPDIFVGRISVDNSVELGVYVRKLLKYETDPYRDSNWFNRVLLAAYNETGRFFIATSESVYVYLNAQGYEVIRQYEDGYPPGNTAGVLEAINTGVCIVNHRDHGASRNGGGSFDGWGHPRFTVNNISSLHNGDMTPVFFSPNCESGWFDGETDEYSSRSYESIGEELVRAEGKGAIGYIGSTRISYSGYNDELDKGFWDAIFPDFHSGYPDTGSVNPYTSRVAYIGGILTYGKYYMYDRYVRTNGQPYPWEPDTEKTRTEFEEFNYIGDPATLIRTSMPRELTVDYPPTIPLGNSQFTITVSSNGVPVNGAIVVLSQDTSLYLSNTTDPGGQVTFNISVSTTDTVYVTVSGYNLLPFNGGIQPISSGPYVSVFSREIDDDTLDASSGNGDGIINPGEIVEITFKFKNWGLDIASNVMFKALGDTLCEVLDTTLHSLGDIAPGDSISSDAIPVSVSSNMRDGQTFTIHIITFSDSGDTWASSQIFLVGTSDFEFDNVTINDTNSIQPNGRLDPGESVYMKISIKNIGHGIAYHPKAILVTEDTLLSIPQDTLHFSSIYPDSIATSLDSILISSSPNTMSEHQAEIRALVQTVDGFIDTIEFNITIGQITTADPAGPDTYGYYAYDVTDTRYSEAPHFNWIEISQDGQRLQLSDDDHEIINLPAQFTFRYYGQRYTRLSVCSNGFVSPGAISHHPYSNKQLPYSDNISMIAPFWDDLRPASGNGAGWIYYKFDSTRHAVIVEYDSVAHYAHNGIREKFEVIIFDSDFYPTPTGDSPILFQYKTVANPSSCTIGIEDLTETDAIQYLYNGSYHRAAAELVDSFAIKFTTAVPTEVGEQPGFHPSRIEFTGVFPNLVRNNAKIRFVLPSRSFVEIKVFDVSGRVVKHLLKRKLDAGTHAVSWRGEADNGESLRSGIYFIDLKVGGEFESVKKVLIMR